LIRKNTRVATMEFSRCARSRMSTPADGPVSQNSTAHEASYVEVDVVLGGTGHRTSKAHRRASRPPE
jgi:hypothetical protein